jgi:predicted O-methyltransferase YrrM
MSADAAIGAKALRELIKRYYGDECRILAVRRSGSGAFILVVEATLRGRPLRLLGTVGRSRELMEHSAMDLGAPERLVFPYERMMLTALALVAAPRSILLLGLGGGAMLRHLDAYLPDAAVTVVERDAAVIALAREYFHIKRKITRADAEDVVADSRGQFDAVMVDLYDAGGGAALDERFWQDCVAALRPGGAVAVNWAGGWSGSDTDGTPHQRLVRTIPRLAGTILVAERGPRGNIAQLVPTVPGFRVTSLGAQLRAFASRHGLPREDRDILQRCDLSQRYPAPRQSGKLGAAPQRGGKRGRPMA